MIKESIKYFFSIVVTNYNGKDYLTACIESILESYFKNFEIIVIDNGSTDGSMEAVHMLKQRAPQLRLISNDRNLGPAAARNQGLDISQGEFIAFLDNDTKVSPAWLDEALKLFKSDEGIGACQCKLVLAKEKTLDSLGEFLGQFGFLVNVVPMGERDEPGIIDDNIDILSAKGAGVIFRKAALEKAGILDEDYFIYLEETDVCWRIWLAGYKVKLCMKSIVYHEFGTTSVIMPGKINYLVKFHGSKNYVCTLIKNLSSGYLLRILPVHIFLWIGIALYFLFKLQIKSFGYILKGIGWNIYYLPRTIQKRRIIQNRRKVSDKELLSKVLKKKPFRYYLNKFLDQRPLGHAVGWDKGE